MPKSPSSVKRKKKLNLQAFFGAVILLLIAIGSIAAMVLSKQNADTRQQAYGGNSATGPVVINGACAVEGLCATNDQGSWYFCQNTGDNVLQWGIPVDGLGQCVGSPCSTGASRCFAATSSDAGFVNVCNSANSWGLNGERCCLPGMKLKNTASCECNNPGEYFCGASQNGQYPGGCANTGGLTCNQWLLQNYGSGEVPTGGGGSVPTPTPAPKCTVDLKMVRTGGTSGSLVAQEISPITKRVKDPETGATVNAQVFTVPEKGSFTLRAKVSGENRTIRRVRFEHLKENPTTSDVITPNGEVKDNDKPYELQYRIGVIPNTSPTIMGVVKANVDLRTGTTNNDNVCKTKVFIEVAK